MARDRERIRAGEEPLPSAREVKDLPPSFKQWMRSNGDRIDQAARRGTVPHWYTDNANFIEYQNHDPKKWERTAYFYETKGYLVRDKTRVRAGKRNKQERNKLEKETHMSYTFAKAGYRIEMLEEVPGISSPDVLIDGIKAELKSLSSYKMINKRAKEATSKQGAEIVLFEFDTFGSNHLTELYKLESLNIHGMYYVKGEDRVRRF